METPAAGTQPPIRDYAALGDCHGFALVSRGGSVDWCCLGRFDAEPIFCRLLDWENGGYFSVHARDPSHCARRYLDGTNVLRTEQRTASGAFAVTDFFVVGRRPGAGLHDYVTLAAPGWLVRIVECLEGEAEIEVVFRPSVAFAAKRVHLQRAGEWIGAPGAPGL